ncbi:MAG: hypothetical protein AAFP20_07075 [Cyanobacteria bacterium J06614_10]
MTIKLCRKAFAGVALAVSILLTGFVPKVEASTPKDLRNLSESELLGGSLQVGHSGLSVGDSSDAIANVVRKSVVNNVDAANGFSPVRSAPIASDMLKSSEIAQSNVAQEVPIPVDDTFAPLTEEEIRQQLLIDPNAVLDRPRPVPGSGFLTPSAYGADWGDAFIGLAGVTAGNRSDLDGSASVGIGFGDAIRNIGAEVSVGIISLDGFADDGIVGFKLHKVFPQVNNLAVAAGWSNAIKWGDANDAEDTFYGVVTQRFDLQPEKTNPLPLTVSLGIGTGSFRSTGAIAAGDNAPNLFGSLGLRVIPELSVVSGWTGSGLGLGVSAAPFEFPLILTAGVSDVTDNTVEGPRFNASLGYSFSF